LVAIKQSWKTRLYDSYVSSGQAGNTNRLSQEPAQLFRPREAYIRQAIARHLPQDREARILDLGCGHGAFLYFLSRAGYTHIAGVDTSSEQIELAHRLGIPQAEMGCIAEFLGGREDQSVDAILLMDVIEHLTRQELFDLLDDVYRVLAPGGICLVHAPNAEGIHGMRIRYGDLTHEAAFTASSASQIFRCIGFRAVQAYEDNPVVHGFKSLARRIIWDCLTLPDRLLLFAETGAPGAILSQNFLIRITK
jgi:2-polyprenyl-3-methyl-5-hydroxy-6-metoxy-1,4-benzoquinol methylase